MNKYDRQRKLYKELVKAELCRAVKYLWKFEFLSSEWKQIDDRCERLKAILLDIELER